MTPLGVLDWSLAHARRMEVGDCDFGVRGSAPSTPRRTKQPRSKQERGCVVRYLGGGEGANAEIIRGRQYSTSRSECPGGSLGIDFPQHFGASEIRGKAGRSGALR